MNPPNLIARIKEKSGSKKNFTLVIKNNAIKGKKKWNSSNAML